MTIKAPYLTYTEVGRLAEDFLTQYHTPLELPIHIEHVIEFELGLDIAPFPYLYKKFGQSGFLSFDRKTIFIDEYQYENFIEKYRFTLAHEIGHFVIHRSFYDNLFFESMEEYINFLHSIPQEDIYWFETHGDWFAGQLLVPTTLLEKYCIDLLESNREKFSNHNPLPMEFWSYASNELAIPFEVNPIVVDIRISKEGFIEKFQNYYSK